MGKTLTDYNRDIFTGDSQNTTSILWQPAKYGEQALYDDIVRLDPALADILKPEDGFKVTFEGYKYSVKVYDNDLVTVYRQKKSYSSSSQSNRYNTNGHSNPSNQFNNQKFSYKGSNSRELDHIYFENKTIKEVKLVKLKEHLPEEGWEIFGLRPIIVMNEEPHLTLVKLSTLTDTKE